MYKIFVVEDDAVIARAVVEHITSWGWEARKAEDLTRVMEEFTAFAPHLVLLDIMMPGLDGFAVLKRIRTESHVPAIMFTARGEDYDKILGLELGADDYITKPYNPMVVVARIKAQLRRSYDYRESGPGAEEELRCFDIVLNRSEGMVTKGGSPVELTRTEFLILELFMRNRGRIFTKQQIFDYAWDSGYIADDNTIMVHISNLRSKIEDNPRAPRILKTIKGLGYKLEKE